MCTGLAGCIHLGIGTRKKEEKGLLILLDIGFWGALQAAELQIPSNANLALVNLVTQRSIRVYNVGKRRLLAHKAWKVDTSQ